MSDTWRNRAEKRFEALATLIPGPPFRPSPSASSLYQQLLRTFPIFKSTPQQKGSYHRTTPQWSLTPGHKTSSAAVK